MKLPHSNEYLILCYSVSVFRLRTDMGNEYRGEGDVQK
jgi:hypothetical protein